MIGEYASVNGNLVPPEQAVVPIDDVSFGYGYGVYETLKLRRGIVYFPERHEGRLFHSAAIIGLPHVLRERDVVNQVRALIAANPTVRDANIKLLLIGGRSADDARLYMMLLNPLYPDRTLYRDGAAVITYRGERRYPEAKTLEMLMSTLAYRTAREAGAYDALLVAGDGVVTEGTRTNLFAIDGDSVLTAPAGRVLLGVTQITLGEALADEGIELREDAIHVDDLGRHDGYFLTSTSSKVMPIGTIDGRRVEIPPPARRIMTAYDRFLDRYAETYQV